MWTVRSARSVGGPQPCTARVSSADCSRSGRVGRLTRKPRLNTAAGRCTHQVPCLASLSQVSAAPLGPDLAWPTRFKECYTLGKCIGSGAFGTVHLATDRRTGDEVAVKILSKSRAKQTKDRTLRKLKREADILSQLQGCDGVVRLLGRFEDDGFAFLAMEYCGGGDLEQLLEARVTLTEPEIAVVLFQCLKVIAACHAERVLVGDVKPANFVLKHQSGGLLSQQACSQQPWLKAVDFGCSQSTQTGEALTRRTGTPVYMSPEVFRRQYGLQADMWSLGMMFYYLATGRFPFWETMDLCRSSTLDDVMHAVTGDDVPIPFDVGALQALSPAGLDLLRRLLVRDPASRITAAAALEHKWFCQQLPRRATSQGSPVNSIVPFSGMGATKASMPDTAKFGFERLLNNLAF